MTTCRWMKHLHLHTQAHTNTNTMCVCACVGFTYSKFFVDVNYFAKIYTIWISFILLSADAATVPVVCVAFGGGSGTLETIRCAINRGTPAIVVKVF